jgi:hypothetical protein
VASLAAEMTPYVSAAMAAYGEAVLAKVPGRGDRRDSRPGLQFTHAQWRPRKYTDMRDLR